MTRIADRKDVHMIKWKPFTCADAYRKMLFHIVGYAQLTRMQSIPFLRTPPFTVHTDLYAGLA